jgi:hypothetical protein
MLVLLTTIVLSISSNDVKERIKKLGNAEGKRAYGIFRHINYSTKVLVNEVDNQLCPAAYKDALAKLKLVVTAAPVRGSVNFLDAADDAAKLALGIFIDLCEKTYAVKACGDVADAQVAKPDVSGADKFSKNCAITDPTADTENCYGAYDAFIKALEALKPPSPRVNLKATAAELGTDFLDKCPKTVNGLDCFGTLIAIDSVTGPGYVDLANVQKNCKVEPPKTNTDMGLLSFSAKSKLIIMISLMINFYFMI